MEPWRQYEAADVYVDPAEGAVRDDTYIRDDLLALMSAPWGRRLVHWLIYDVGQLEGECFDPTVKDGQCAGQHAARIDGRRDRARGLKRLVSELAPDHYRAMRREHDDAETRRQNSSEGIDQ